MGCAIFCDSAYCRSWPAVFDSKLLRKIIVELSLQLAPVGRDARLKHVKHTLRTYEMICYYFIGLADEKELLNHIAKLKPHDLPA